MASMHRRRGKHTTVIEGLEPLLRILDRHPEIEVAFGRITTGLPTGHHILKIHQLSGGVEAVFRGTRNKQILHLYGNGETIEKLLLEQAGEKMIVKTAKTTSTQPNGKHFPVI